MTKKKTGKQPVDKGNTEGTITAGTRVDRVFVQVIPRMPFPPPSAGRELPVTAEDDAPRLQP